MKRPAGTTRPGNFPGAGECHSRRAVCALIAACSLMALLFLACKDSGGDHGASVPAQKFYSADEPGKWEAQVQDHDPECRIVRDDRGRRLLEVSVKFGRRADPGHYVEVITLLNGKGKVIGTHSFERGEIAQAGFEIPDKTPFPLTVVSKCNRHDMWKKEIKTVSAVEEN